MLPIKTTQYGSSVVLLYYTLAGRPMQNSFLLYVWATILSENCLQMLLPADSYQFRKAKHGLFLLWLGRNPVIVGRRESRFVKFAHSYKIYRSGQL